MKTHLQNGVSFPACGHIPAGSSVPEQDKKRFLINRIILGTAQFGLDYGIANQGGRPEYRTCLRTTEAALEVGISIFDTAAAYGESEKVLGRIFSELGVRDRVTVVSKIQPLCDKRIPAAQIRMAVEQSLENSLRNLGLDVLPVVLYHRDADMEWMEMLLEMKQQGRVRRVGVSVDTPEGARKALAHPLVEAVQLPHNLFDHRFSPDSLFPEFQRKEVCLFARSAFLQGLLLMPEERIPESLRAVVPVRRRIEGLALEAGMTMPELCLRYSLSFPEITGVLIGVDSAEQLRENAAMAERGPLDGGILEKINEYVPDFPEEIIRPSRWRKDK